MSLIIKRPWTSQPQVAVGVNWGNPITKGLIDVAWMGVGGPKELVSNTNSIVTGSRVVTSGGISFIRDTSITAASWSYSPVDTRFQVSDNVTMLTFGTVPRTGTTSSYTGFFGSGGGYYIGNRYGVGNIYGRAGGITIDRASLWKDKLAVRGLTYSSPHLNLYENGSVVETLGGGGNITTGAYDSVQINNAANSTPQDTTLWAAFWGRILSDAEHRSIAANPWQLFQPLSRQIWVPGAAAAADWVTLSSPDMINIAATTATPQVYVTYN